MASGGANEILRKTSDPHQVRPTPPEYARTPRICPRILISNSRRTGGRGVSRNYSYFKISLHGICHERGSYFKNITLHRNFLILKTWGGCERSSEIHPPSLVRPSVASYDILILKIARSVPILLLRCWCVQAFMRPLVREPGSSKTQRGIPLNLYIVTNRPRSSPVTITIIIKLENK